MSKGQKPWEMTIEGLLNLRSDLLEDKRRHSARSKGKAKATQQDDEREAEFRRTMQDIEKAISDIRESHQKSTQEMRRPPTSRGTFVPTARTMSLTKSDDCGKAVGEHKDADRVWNPFTNSYAHRETGFEPRPSGLRGGSKQTRQDQAQGQDISGNVNLKIQPVIPKPGKVSLFDDPPIKKRREVVARNHDSKDDLLLPFSQEKSSFMGKVVRSCGICLSWSNSIANDSNQGLSNFFPQSRNTSKQHSKHESGRERYVREWQREVQRTFSEEESLRLALALEEKERAKAKENELSHRLAMKLSLQEGTKMAERQHSSTKLLTKSNSRAGRNVEEATTSGGRDSAFAAENSTKRSYHANRRRNCRTVERFKWSDSV